MAAITHRDYQPLDRPAEEEEKGDWLRSFSAPPATATLNLALPPSVRSADLPSIRSHPEYAAADDEKYVFSPPSLFVMGAWSRSRICQVLETS